MSTFEKLKQEVISILKNQEKKEKTAIKKSLQFLENDYKSETDYINKSYGIVVVDRGDSIPIGTIVRIDNTIIAKAGFPVGTHRTWKGQEFVKIAPNKWRPFYRGETRGAKHAISRLITRAEHCQNVEELLQLVNENIDRFKDDNGKELPIVEKLRNAVQDKNTRLSNGDTSIKPKAKTPRSKSTKEKKPVAKDNNKEDKDNSEPSKQEAIQAEMKKVAELFNKFNDYNFKGPGYWLKADSRADVHHKAFCRAEGLKNLVKWQEILKNEGYDVPTIEEASPEIWKKYNEYLAADNSRTVDKILSGIKQTKIDELVKKYKDPMKDKYAELDKQFTKPEKRQYTKEEENQILNKITDHLKIKLEEYKKDWYTRACAETIVNKQKEKGLKEYAEIEIKSDNEIIDNLAKRSLAKVKENEIDPSEIMEDMGDSDLWDRLVTYEVVKMAKEKLNKMADNSSMVDVPVDEKTMNEAISIIGSDVDAILNGHDIYGNKRQTLTDKIKRRIRNSPDIARAMLVYIKQEQERTGKTLYKPSNSLWGYLPKLNQMAEEAMTNGESEKPSGVSGNLYENEDGTYIVEDKNIGRYQIYFPDKPDYDTRAYMKSHGFRWSPTNSAWQCFNTGNGERSMRDVAEYLGLKKTA